MTDIPVALGDRSYTVTVTPGIFERIGEELQPYANRSRLLVVTDDNVARHYRSDFERLASAAGLHSVFHVLKAGEKSKSWTELEKICDWLLEMECERNDVIVALGGGVVGDITGFAASIIKRGCGFIQIPTTLLSQVDSSVGGKTAINAKAGKNMIGAFYQPKAVFIDPTMLSTLPRRELGAGYAEVVKYGLIDDREFFEWCEIHGPKVLDGDVEAQTVAIIRSVTAKARIVVDDERETTGKRVLLNLGHTFGHALEAETGFGDTLLHGEAVACGIAIAARYSTRLGLMTAQETDRITRHLSASSLPVTLEQAHCAVPGSTLVKHMLHDKKASGGNLPFLLMRGIGNTFLSRDVDLEDLRQFMDQERSLQL